MGVSRIKRNDTGCCHDNNNPSLDIRGGAQPELGAVFCAMDSRAGKTVMVHTSIQSVV